MTRRMSRALAISLAAGIATITACAPGERQAIEPQVGLEDTLPVPQGAAEQVQGLARLRAVYDEDGDGFVSPAEAEGYYRQYFAELDDDNDGRLSLAELRPEAPGTPDLEVANEELVVTTEQEYVDINVDTYNLRADRTTGMMSTRDFDEMVGGRDAAISTPRREPLP